MNKGQIHTFISIQMNLRMWVNLFNSKKHYSHKLKPILHYSLCFIPNYSPCSIFSNVCTTRFWTTLVPHQNLKQNSPMMGCQNGLLKP